MNIYCIFFFTIYYHSLHIYLSFINLGAFITIYSIYYKLCFAFITIIPLFHLLLGQLVDEPSMPVCNRNVGNLSIMILTLAALLVHMCIGIWKEFKLSWAACSERSPECM